MRKISRMNREKKPLVEGVKRALDGHWYMPDPARPGKYLRVIQTETPIGNPEETAEERNIR
jgi:hypothetical protein